MFIAHAKFHSTNSSTSSPDRDDMNRHRLVPIYLMWLEEEPFPKYVVHKIRAVAFCFTSVKNDRTNFLLRIRQHQTNNGKRYLKLLAMQWWKNLGRRWAGVVLVDCPINWASSKDKMHFRSRSCVIFDIHMSAHLNIIPNYSQPDATFLIYLFLQTLYMFQAVPPPIIRSTNCTYSFRCCQPILLLSATMEEMLHLLHGSSQQQYCLTVPESVCTVVCS